MLLISVDWFGKCRRGNLGVGSHASTVAPFLESRNINFSDYGVGEEPVGGNAVHADVQGQMLAVHFELRNCAVGAREDFEEHGVHAAVNVLDLGLEAALFLLLSLLLHDLELFENILDLSSRVVQQLEHAGILLVCLQLVLEQLGGVQVLEDLLKPHIPHHVEEPVANNQHFLAADSGIQLSARLGYQGPAVRAVLLQVFVEKVILTVLDHCIHVSNKRRSQVHSHRAAEEGECGTFRSLCFVGFVVESLILEFNWLDHEVKAARGREGLKHAALEVLRVDFFKDLVLHMLGGLPKLGGDHHLTLGVPVKAGALGDEVLEHGVGGGLEGLEGGVTAADALEVPEALRWLPFEAVDNDAEGVGRLGGEVVVFVANVHFVDF